MKIVPIICLALGVTALMACDGSNPPAAATPTPAPPAQSAPAATPAAPAATPATTPAPPAS